MPESYRIVEASEASRPTPLTNRDAAVRPLLWLLLMVSAVANIASSKIGINMFIGAGFGLITLACAAALVVHHRRRRR